MMKLELIGNLGKDCIVNDVNGTHVINFSVAHSEKVRDKDNIFVEKTRWVDCAYWTDKTGVANFLRKGQQVYAEGFPDIKTYHKKDGTTGVSLALRVTLLQLVGYSQSEESIKFTETEKNAANQAVVDDLPF
jgi:single-strand DNA-binding protein